jgi:hypothetical protein
MLVDDLSALRFRSTEQGTCPSRLDTTLDRMKTTHEMARYGPTDWGKLERVVALDTKGLLARLEWAILQFEAAGVRMAPDCRARNALKTLKAMEQANRAPSEPKPRGFPDAALAVAHQRLAVELYFIAAAASVSDYVDHPFIVEKLDAAVRGPDFAEGRDRSSRNIEFELAVATRLRLGGLAVYRGEPDLRFRFGSEILGVAVKRITSQEIKQLKMALKDAVDQIERSKLRGIIVLNLESRLDGLAENASDDELFALVDTIYDSSPELARYYEARRVVVGLASVSALVRPRPASAPNGLPELEVILPWRLRRFCEFWDVQRARNVFDNWRKTLEENLFRCLTQLPPFSWGQ